MFPTDRSVARIYRQKCAMKSSFLPPNLSSVLPVPRVPTIASSIAALVVAMLLTGCAVGVDAVNFDDASVSAADGPGDVTLARFERSDDLAEDDDFLLFGATWPIGTITIDVDRLPRVELPNLDDLANPNALVRNELGDLVTDPIEGVEVIACDAETGSKDASVVGDGPQFVSEGDGDGSLTQLQVDDDGTGRFYSMDTGNLITIAVNDDGTGEYFNRGPDRLTTVKVDANGAGEFFDRTNTAAVGDAAGEAEGDVLFTLTLGADGSIRQFVGRPGLVETVEVGADGSVEHVKEVVGEADDANPNVVVSTKLRADGGWETRRTKGTDFVELVVQPDGTGMYADSTIGRATFDASGSGESLQVEVPTRPEFLVDVQFPPIGELGQLAPTCETTIRVDQSLLFDSGSAALNSSAGPVLERLVATLNANGRSITIAGHTDAAGSEESNERLSILRAEVVEGVMAVQGLKVDTSVIGYGESEPIADNFQPDGSPDRDGMALNRRVEIVVND